MIKKIIKLTEGGCIYFTKEEMMELGMKIGDQVDLSDNFKIEVIATINKVGNTYKKIKK
jgi:hypothetical protein